MHLSIGFHQAKEMREKMDLSILGKSPRYFGQSSLHEICQEKELLLFSLGHCVIDCVPVDRDFTLTGSFDRMGMLETATIVKVNF